jgi:uncharacterized lipoprotein YmbA
MSAARLALAASATLAVAACSLGKPIPPATTYVVELPISAAAPAAQRRPEVLQMGNVHVAAAFSGNALVYRADEVRYVSDPYNAFIADPAAMLGNRMAAWLDRAGPFKTVAQPDSARPASYVLEASVTELYGDFRKGQPPAAVMAVQFALVDQTGVRPKMVLERTLSSRVDIGEASPDALVRGYGAALAEVLAELVADLRATAHRADPM